MSLVALEQAKHAVLKFLRLTRNYELHKLNIDKFQNIDKNSKDFDMDKTSLKNSQAAFDANMISQAYERSEKIRRFKEQKEIEAQLSAMNVTLHVDDEHKTKLFKTFIKFWINKCIDDLKVIDGKAKQRKQRL